MDEKYFLNRAFLAIVWLLRSVILSIKIYDELSGVDEAIRNGVLTKSLSAHIYGPGRKITNNSSSAANRMKYSISLSPLNW